MSIPKLLFAVAIILFAGIGIVAFSKKKETPSRQKEQVVASSEITTHTSVNKPLKQSIVSKNTNSTTTSVDPDFPNIDRVFQLFTTTQTKLPIVETVEYSSSVPWLKGRPAWIADYAVHYGTSKHFIARSLNGSPDYFSQKVVTGSRFNVFKKDKKIEFHLLVDLSKLKLALYYLDLATKERVLLKVYKIGVGRLDPSKKSGNLTPVGTYQLGDKVAVYKPGTIDFFHDQKTEMIRIFGTRWIPFGQEIGECSEPSKGYGIHGAPWVVDEKTGQLVEKRDYIGRYDSDGCIRMLLEDMEELFAIVITKPSFIHIVKNFHDIVLPGNEVGTPSR